MFLVRLLLSLLVMLTKHNQVQKMKPSKLLASFPCAGSGTSRMAANSVTVDISINAMCLAVVVLIQLTNILFVPLQLPLQKLSNLNKPIVEHLLSSVADCSNSAPLLGLNDTYASVSTLNPAIEEGLFDLSVKPFHEVSESSLLHVNEVSNVTCWPVSQATSLCADNFDLSTHGGCNSVI